LLSIIMPPFQVTDELNHLLRADQVARGTLISARLGGRVDAGLDAFGRLYQKMWFNPEVKQSVALARDAGALKWRGAEYDVNFQNTAQYGPLLYVPQAVGLLLGRLTGLTLAQTLVAVRVINGVTACIISCLTLCICRRAHALTFATLLLPMTLSEFSSASQDALIISLSLLVVAIASRVIDEERPARTGEFALFAFVIMATTLARPPQIALALLLPAFMRGSDPAWGRKVLIGAAAAIPIAVWMWLLRTLMPIGATESPSLQFEHLVAHPLTLIVVLVNSFDWALVHSVAGWLGWFDTPLPACFYTMAAIMLGLATVAPGNRGPRLFPAALAVLVIVDLFLATAFALYLSWTPVDLPRIHGLQGRYILPVLPLFAWPIPGYLPWLERVLGIGWYPVLLFPIVSLAMVPGVIMERYYGSWQVMAQSVRVLLLP
jgi:uncharacterized membrane protein